MSFLHSRSVTQRTILRIMIGGFGLVMLLLVAGSAVGVKNARSIQSGASHLLREQSLTARLLNEIQIEQATLNAVMYELSSSETFDPSSLLSQLEEADEGLTRIAASASGTPEESLWRSLIAASHEFSGQARQTIASGDPSASVPESLFARHERVVGIINRLVLSSTAKVATLQEQIDRQSRELLNDSMVLLGSCVVLAFLCAVITVRSTTSMFAQMQMQASELSRVSWHMLESQEAAARRFSHELHDELGQSLAAVKANLMSLASGNTEERRADCLHLVDEAISNVRELSQLLRPVILDDFGLDAGLRWLSERFTYRTNISVNYTSNLTGRLSDDTETQLFRIAQEALTNVARHSGAKAVDIVVKQESGRVRLMIADNGKGLGQIGEGDTGSLGMIGMRARARQAGGELTLGTSASGGLSIDVWVPASRLQHEHERALAT